MKKQPSRPKPEDMNIADYQDKKQDNLYKNRRENASNSM